MPIAKYDHGNIFYEEKGAGEPLVFIHGVGLDHTIWHKQLKGLSEYFRVIVYDMIGHGRSEHPPGPYSLSQFVEQLSGLLNYLNIKKCHLLGFSMGGMVAQAFALKNKNKLKTLTIMSAVANRTARQRSAILQRVDEVKTNGAAGTIEPAIQRWFNTSFLKENEEAVNEVRIRLQTNNPSSYLAAYTLFATGDEELWPQLDQIDVPTLIVTGENDVGSTSHMSSQMHEKIKGSELQIVPEIRHMLPMEGAEVINEMILSFIRNNSSI
ncbi:3-oxoadipate enol-lactonase [Siminovitchia terrae]|uniref:3-oxoadipate enol-lactonase n=1 Tax=Siminovitchia terrae TaxID=1914933 RepID=A0A429XCG3_SIMTE|nr:alpha/beta hydrolase [Siminovitchia terrae]RST61032.1 alpha/beta hydrolase [Siminovitchia terrae]GIN97672.1 3-oxoadipate enol-lactonase [Siminovitchia terrae]